MVRLRAKKLSTTIHFHISYFKALSRCEKISFSYVLMESAPDRFESAYMVQQSAPESVCNLRCFTNFKLYRMSKLLNKFKVLEQILALRE